ncbi:GMC family oxidoreductase [Pseudomonas cavernicola]|uniref:GMC family oxidoreductase n=1 Tax=Pseudomonas cavernicola TaxID=2320866 RepID=A0A418XM39_9PSED|nr:GMC family oxidoreductase [Pseudomonas cavernicola]RJG13542.1 GMC family oxidoreductase [Pseudomonas cavernicola]
MKDDYDVIVIGSGVAGALSAWKLAQAGKYRILILEAGHNGISHGQRVEFHHTMDVQGARGDMFAPYMALESRKYAPAAEKAQCELAEQKNDPNNYYDYAPDFNGDPFKASYNRMVGQHLVVARKHGRDWPLDYNELEPWYCQAEWELGVSGNHEEWDGLHGGYRSQAFPMLGIPLSYSDQQVKRRVHGKSVRGKVVHVVTTPQARNTRAFDNRPACEGHSNCIPLCPIQAKYDATVHLRRALQLPGVELRTRAVVSRLEKGKDGRVSKVHFIDWTADDNPQPRCVQGAVVVLAAHAIETPKILLNSGGLANSSGQVGRNLMDHVQFELIAIFPEPLYPFRGPQSIASIEDFRDGPCRAQRSAFRMTVGNDGWGRTGSPATVIDGLLKEGKYSSALPAAIAERIPKMLRLSFSTEMLPESTNRIELSDKTDALGLPRPRFTFDVGDYARGGLREGLETATELFGLMGATISPSDKPLINPQTGRMNWNTAAHIMGTTIMGDDPKDSVVDRWGRAHDVPNLWIVGSSVFTTSATANPTMTIAALTLRTAAAIHRQMQGEA